jgi:hypothetical protein
MSTVPSRCTSHLSGFTNGACECVYRVCVQSVCQEDMLQVSVCTECVYRGHVASSECVYRVCVQCQEGMLQVSACTECVPRGHVASECVYRVCVQSVCQEDMLQVLSVCTECVPRGHVASSECVSECVPRGRMGCERKANGRCWLPSHDLRLLFLAAWCPSSSYTRFR